MKLDSKYFDRIRIRPKRTMDDASPRSCDWSGCTGQGCYLAPKGRGREGEYYRFCLDHVRQYNKNYNYFNGMSDAEVYAFQKASVTGHRPTWATGVRGLNDGGPGGQRTARGFQFDFDHADPFSLFKDAGLSGDIRVERRPIRNAERKCLRTLNLDETASAEEIKASYKALVKLHHPDRHGGDRSSEEKLREVIKAYQYLKQAGLC
jgi:hypothetical protein